jgi:patatin-related protein
VREHRAVETVETEKQTVESPVFDPEQEVRFAVVLYGGASLAIYMYGIAEEFLHLVRATAPAERVSDTGMAGTLAYPTPESTEAVYRRLGQLLPLGPAASGDGAVRTRFVVDVISGTSAGGINGVCLAKALANGSSLAGLKNLWQNDGNIGVLVADRRSAYEDDAEQTLVAGLKAPFEAKSVLNADRMLMRLVKAFDDMDAEDPAHVPPLVDELDLWVTATDLDGKQLPIQLANRLVMERRFANRYHFTVSPQDGRNDFERKDNPFLAFAARCTSAFPFAFEAMNLGHLADFTNVPPPDPAWPRFYPEYTEEEFPARRFSDGGILDNKPFSYATGSLVGRRAPLPVDRKLVYVEPDPGVPGAAPPPKAWNGLQTAQAALLSIPRAEGIHGDIQTVLNRNRVIERAREILAQAATDDPEQKVVQSMLDKPQDTAEWARKSLAETIADRGWGVGYASYHRLKVRGLVDYLAGLISRANGLVPDSDDELAVHYLVRAWKDAHYAEQPTETIASENQLLLDFSLPYRWRRMDYVMKRLRDLRSTDAATVAGVLRSAGLPEKLPAGDNRDAIFLQLRRDLTAAADPLYTADRKLATPVDPRRQDVQASPLAAFDLKNRDDFDFRSILETPDDDAMLTCAKRLLATVGDAAFTGVAGQVIELIHAAADDSRDRVGGALGLPVSDPKRAGATDLESTLKYALRFHYDAFEAFDAILYPLEFGTDIAETNPVEIRRISHLECDHPLDVTGDARKLCGVSINHFGAFFDDEWRKHDMLWGRLNASESLIRALLPPDHPEFEQLIGDAHRAIVAEFVAGETPPPAPPEQAWDWFVSEYDKTIPKQPEHDRTVAVLNRAAVVTGKVVGGVVPAKAAAGWAVLESVLPPNPGGATAVRRAARALLLGTLYGKVAVGVWAVALVAGIVLIASGASVALGIGLVVLAVVVAGIVLGALWYAIGKLRKMVEGRVGTFIFGAPASKPAGQG